jgi:hypothetical protein
VATKQQAIERLNWCGDDEEIAVAIWCEGDIMSRAKQRGFTLSQLSQIQEKVKEIIRQIDHTQDSSLGITWDTVDVYTDRCLKEE